jgi:hypothetical protein
VQAVHPDYGFAWTAPRSALITQTTVPYARVEGGRVLRDWIDRSLSAYHPATRVLINERIEKRKPGYARRTIRLVRQTPI